MCNIRLSASGEGVENRVFFERRHKGDEMRRNSRKKNVCSTGGVGRTETKGMNVCDERVGRR